MKRILALGVFVLLIAGCQPQPSYPGLSDDDLVGTYVAATLTAAPTGKYLPLETDQPSQVTPEPGETQGSPAASLTPTLTPTPTPTFTPTPTPTATLTPTVDPGDPVLSLGVPTFDDKFTGGVNFYEYDNEQASYQIEEGQMVLIAKKANSYETWSLSWGDIDDFYLEATGRFGADCSNKDRFGMIFRAPDTTEGYIISISCDGSYRLSTWESEDEEYTVIKGWANSSYANTGPGSTNRLGIRAEGTLLIGYINGSKVFEVNDSTFSEGRMGVVVAASNTTNFTAYLTRVAYWDLP